MDERVLFDYARSILLEEQFARILTLVADREHWRYFQNLNDVIELYHMQRVIEAGIYPNNLSEGQREKCIAAMALVKPIIGRRFAQISGDTLRNDIDSLELQYQESFWELFITLGVEERVNSSVIRELLEQDKINILYLLVDRKMVKAYGEAIRDFLLNHNEYARELVMEYLEERSPGFKHYFFPNELTAKDRERIILGYIDSPEANANVLKLLSISKGDTKNLPISAKTRLLAKKRFEDVFHRISNTGMNYSYGVNISFLEQKEPVDFSYEGNIAVLKFDVGWILGNLDYPTLMNNFIYLFGYVDLQYRWQHISKRNMLGVIERSIGIKAKREYLVGSGHSTTEMIANGTISGYYHMLRDNGIKLEDIIKWFFEDYLAVEFNVEGFFFNKPSDGANLLEKCRDIAIEIDSILKQFRMYREDGEIDRELFEINTEHMLISNVPSFVVDKYIYPNGDDIDKIFYLLFSDQSCMFYSEERKGLHTAYSVLQLMDVNYSKLILFQQKQVDFLVEKNILEVRDDKIQYSKRLLGLLNDLYHNEFLCKSYLNSYDEELMFLGDKGFIRYGSSLLSEQEQKYFNYIFNDSEFDNGMDLRNKYAHGNQTRDEKEMDRDYLIMLRMMILIILKVNEEFCLMDRK